MSNKGITWRILCHNEIIQEGDEVDRCTDSWKDPADWKPATEYIGKAAPDPRYPGHRLFRRRVVRET